MTKLIVAFRNFANAPKIYLKELSVTMRNGLIGIKIRMSGTVYITKWWTSGCIIYRRGDGEFLTELLLSPDDGLPSMLISSKNLTHRHLSICVQVDIFKTEKTT
jgi:hypothetical protein